MIRPTQSNCIRFGILLLIFVCSWVLMERYGMQLQEDSDHSHGSLIPVRTLGTENAVKASVTAGVAHEIRVDTDHGPAIVFFGDDSFIENQEFEIEIGEASDPSFFVEAADDVSLEPNSIALSPIIEMKAPNRAQVSTQRLRLSLPVLATQRSNLDNYAIYAVFEVPNQVGAVSVSSILRAEIEYKFSKMATFWVPGFASRVMLVGSPRP